MYENVHFIQIGIIHAIPSIDKICTRSNFKPLYRLPIVIGCILCLLLERRFRTVPVIIDDIGITISIIVDFFNRICFAVMEQVTSQWQMTLLQERIRNDEATASRVVIAASEIVQASFLIEHIPAIPEGLDRTQRAGKRTSLTEHLAPSIVSIRYYFGAVAVNQANDVTLQVVQVGIGSTIEKNYARTILGIVEEMQVVAAIEHVYNILAMQGIEQAERSETLPPKK